MDTSSFDAFADEIPDVSDDRSPYYDESKPAAQPLEAVVDLRPVEWDDADEAYPFSIPEWGNLAAVSLSPRVMSRHFFITGETGSGKTFSAVKPLLRSALRYRCDDIDRRAALLVIDPKHELSGVVREASAACERDIVLLGHSSPRRVALFEGREHRTPAEQVGYALSLCSPAFAAAADAPDGYWGSSAVQIITALVGIREALCAYGTDLSSALRFCEMETRVRLTLEGWKTARYPQNYFATDLAFCQLAMTEKRLLRPLGEICKHFGVPQYLTAKLISLADAPEGQRGSELSTAILYLTDLAGMTLNRYVDLTPQWLAAGGNAVSIRAIVDKGDAIVFAPGSRSTGADAAGRVLKTKYFESAFERENKERPLFYICDEFQRYLTADSESGEQAFLDRCRAYRVVCVLASQSLASLRSSLALQGAARRSDIDSTIGIILGNTGNKLFFRTTEPDTFDSVRRLMPRARASRANAVDVYPPSSLLPGECYYVLADGRELVVLKCRQHPVYHIKRSQLRYLPRCAFSVRSISSAVW